MFIQVISNRTTSPICNLPNLVRCFIPVKVLTSTKRPAASAHHSKSSSSSSKRSQNGENQSSITHTGLPVNPFTAKALASKLNERNQFLNGAKSQATKTAQSAARQTSTGNAKVAASSTKEVPVPPLISIQTRPSGNENGQPPAASTTVTSTNSTEDYEMFGNAPAFNMFKSNSTGTNDSARHGSDSLADEMKLVNTREMTAEMLGY